MCYDDDVDDDDDDDVVTLAQFPEIPPVVTKRGCSKNACRWGETNKYEVVRTAVPHQSVRETARTNEVRYTTPYHLQPNSTRNISMVLYVHPKKRPIGVTLFAFQGKYFLLTALLNPISLAYHQCFTSYNTILDMYVPTVGYIISHGVALSTFL